MKKTNAMSAATLIVGLAAFGVAGLSQAAEQEKCYGVVKAGKNDCATKTTSCAGTSTEDGQSDAYVVVPEGLCERLVGGSLKPM